MRALLVDDSRAMRRLEAAVLHQLGFEEVDESSTPGDALERPAAAALDLIVLDWDLLGTSGLEFVHRLRGAGIDAPIVIITTFVDDGRVTEALCCGSAVRIVKPFSPDLLSQRVREALELHAAAAA